MSYFNISYKNSNSPNGETKQETSNESNVQSGQRVNENEDQEIHTQSETLDDQTPRTINKREHVNEFKESFESENLEDGHLTPKEIKKAYDKIYYQKVQQARKRKKYLQEKNYQYELLRTRNDTLSREYQAYRNLHEDRVKTFEVKKNKWKRRALDLNEKYIKMESELSLVKNEYETAIGKSNSNGFLKQTWIPDFF